MRKLLCANFVRVFRSRVFWVCMAFLTGLGVLLSLSQYRELVQYGPGQASMNHIFFGYALVIGVPCAVFCSLFFGTEYSDGTIRNKLVVGHTRTGIYLANLITCVAAVLLMCAAFLLAVCAVGTPLIGFLSGEPQPVVWTLLGSVMMTVAYCCLCITLSMLCQNKAVAAVMAILGVFLLLLAAAVINARLSAPEFYNGYVFTDSLGNASSESLPNPEYLRGTARAIYEFFYDFLPSGQGLQYANMEAAHLWQMPVYALGISVVSTGVGLILFRKKDLK